MFGKTSKPNIIHLGVEKHNKNRKELKTLKTGHMKKIYFRFRNVLKTSFIKKTESISNLIEHSLKMEANRWYYEQA